MFHKILEFIRKFVEAIRKMRGDATGKSSGGGGKTRRNPWPQCPMCYHRVPALCTDAEEGAAPCGNGLSCGCCGGPHRAPKSATGEAGQDGGKFQTSVQS